jgi:hypothetical protein
MTANDDSARRYSDREVSLILRRTGQLEEERREAGEAGNGLSLAQLEAVAREAGLDGALVRRAAEELDDWVAGRAAGSALLGGRKRLVSERRLDREVSAADLTELAGEINQAFGMSGQVTVLGRSMVWSSSPGLRGRQVAVTVVSHDGATVLRIQEALDQVAGGLFGLVGGLGGAGLGIALGVGIGVFAAPVAAGAVALTCVGGSYALGRSIFSAISSGHQRRLQQLADRLAERIARAPAAGACPVGGTPMGAGPEASLAPPAPGA